MPEPERVSRDSSALDFKKLNTAWQLIGAFTAPILFTVLFIVLATVPGLNYYQWLLWFHLPVIMIHEFEEYIVPGGFKNFINTKTILAPTPLKEETPASEPYIFFVNPIMIWPWVIIGALLYTLPWIGFGAIIFQFLINNVQHTVVFQLRHKGYNPGLFTTIFLLLPFCTLVTWYVIAYNIMTLTDWILSFAVAAGVILLLLSITFTKIRHAKTG